MIWLQTYPRFGLEAVRNGVQAFREKDDTSNATIEPLIDGPDGRLIQRLLHRNGAPAKLLEDGCFCWGHDQSDQLLGNVKRRFVDQVCLLPGKRGRVTYKQDGAVSLVKDFIDG
ncbi:hypothetical protein WI38_12405 [Burkholderia ubonensis]|uniref:Uncharacterized protein n=1 Tax=Burkholderia ubonensis TaxID=101571 RepID=A0A102KNU1_9BURK|nr:hypothetical protein WI35_03495 [Burkholderia ubonensis]KUZ89002.1 hypothetical protein WI39_21325 [Burkholderia ubonensis]KUZ91549.1 hypothetical protein WI38_12405 [Burkholderia ubonensis]